MHRTPRLVLSMMFGTMSVLAAGSCAVAQSGPSPAINPGGGGDDGGDTLDGSDFRYYFSVTTDPWEYNHGRRYSDELKFDHEMLSRDFVILYQHRTGLYPRGGPHLSCDPEYMRRHLEELAKDVVDQIPDPNFSGIAILDYECFPAIWDRVWNRPSDEGPEALDEDFRDDWTEYTRSKHPEFDSLSEEDREQMLREGWEAAVADLFTRSINKARELRPHAKWGFYGYPYRFFKHKREAPVDKVSYGGGYYKGSELNDRLQWMWDAVDIVTPSIYSQRPVGEPTADCDKYCTAAEDLLYVENMIREAQRVANGKPVMPFLTTVYADRQGCEYLQEVSDDTLYGQVVGPALAGADGAILWGHIRNADERADWQRMLDQRILPLMRQGLDLRNRGGSAGDDGDSDDWEPQANADAEGVSGGVRTIRRNTGGVVSDKPEVARQRPQAKAGNRSIRLQPSSAERASAQKIEPAKAGADKASSDKESRDKSSNDRDSKPLVRYNPRTDRISKPNVLPPGAGKKNEADGE